MPKADRSPRPQRCGPSAHAWLDGKTDEPPFAELASLSPVRAVKSRHDCVTIAFDALAEAAGRLSQAEDREETPK